MKTANRVWNHYKELLDNPEHRLVKCNFIASHSGSRKRVYMASVAGLDHTDNPGCHVVLDLYYDTNCAMAIPFATKGDAWKYVETKGKHDRRIVKKESDRHGWKLTLNGDVQ